MEASELIVTPEEPTVSEREEMQNTEIALGCYLQVLRGGQERQPTPPKLVLTDGRQFLLSPQVVRAFQFVLHHMARGDVINLIPMSKMITTNQAAEMLNVSRPFLAKLLKDRTIPFTMVGTHHRLRVGDVLEYKQRRDQRMYEMLDELVAEAQEAGTYFDE